MVPNEFGHSNQTLTLHLKEKEQQEIKTFFSFFLEEKLNISDGDNIEILKHLAFEKIMNSEVAENKSGQQPYLQEVPDKITFNDQWLEHFHQVFPVEIDTAESDSDFKHLFDYAQTTRALYTSKLVTFFRNDPDKIIAAINGMNHIIDINMYVLGETILKKKQDLLNEQKLKNEQINNEFEQFVYVTSHDLQQPLTTLISINSLLEEEFPELLEGDSGVYVQYMKKASDRMSSMVTDLLDYSRIGRWSNRQKVDLNKVVEYVLNDMKSDLRRTSAKIRVADLPSVTAYPVEIKFLFHHLIDNALKFRRKDTHPVIGISASRKIGHWDISVSDNGIGIDSKYFDKVFVIFQKLHNIEKYNGNGCGLAYCKKIAKLHNGEIQIDSTPGRGTTIHFNIPDNE